MRYSEASTDTAYFHLAREYADPVIVATFVTEGEPVSKARARFTNYGSTTRSYTPKKTSDAEKAVRQSFQEAAPDHQPDADSSFGVTALFFNGTRQRRDVDNMLKLILDGLNGVAWADDMQVVEVSGRKCAELPEHARTEVAIYKVGLTAQRLTIPCLRCGEHFPIFPSSKKQYCSKECVYAHRRERDRGLCLVCDQPVTTRKSLYCSTTCANQARRRPAARCLVCSSAVSDPRKRLCRPCYEHLGIGKNHVSHHCADLRHDTCSFCACPCHDPWPDVAAAEASTRPSVIHPSTAPPF